ncbi:hypothetical protein B9Z65_176 [Elsinoe australis]|uniref:Uncharacterized protein n=1 Tax=Elsinoe australis TaxID=40998 RepID=A0A2P7Z7L4_9PEZI|nr:hypothetical protein B9Z65_176 [Elsinoe australis]
MPKLSDIRYSRGETIATITNYYKFLTRLYLPESDVQEPSEDEVIELPRHFPYVELRAEVHGADHTYFADRNGLMDLNNTEDLKVCSESGVRFFGGVPPHVISLTNGGRDNPVFLLVTNLGIVYWYDAPDGPKHNPTREQVIDDPHSWAPEAELKDQFRELYNVPTSKRTVLHRGNLPPDKREPLLEVYRRHGWPDLSRYNKRACLKAVHALLRDRFPDWAEDEECG